MLLEALHNLIFDDAVFILLQWKAHRPNKEGYLGKLIVGLTRYQLCDGTHRTGTPQHRKVIRNFLLAIIREANLKDSL